MILYTMYTKLPLFSELYIHKTIYVNLSRNTVITLNILDINILIYMYKNFGIHGIQTHFLQTGLMFNCIPKQNLWYTSGIHGIQTHPFCSSCLATCSVYTRRQHILIILSLYF